MVTAVLKVYFEKKGPSVIQYDYKNFSNDKFRNNVVNELIKFKIETSRLDIFVNTVLKLYSKNAPVKKCYIKANEDPFMNKVLKKAIMKRSQLKTSFWKKKKKKRNLEVKLLITKELLYQPHAERKTKLFWKYWHFKISDNNMFWKTLKPIFSNKMC